MHASVQFSSVAQSCPTFHDPMNRSTPGLPVHHQLPEFTQTHDNRVSDAIQPSHPLSSPSPPALNLSQHQGLFKWVSSSHQVAKVLEFQLQHQSFQWLPRTWLDLLSVQGTLKSPFQHCSSKASILHFSCVQLFATLWTVAYQVPLSMGFSRQEYWNELPHPPPRDLPNPGTEHASLKSPALAGGVLYHYHYLQSPETTLLLFFSPSRVWLFMTPWTAARQATLSLTISWNLPEFMSITSVMLSSHLIFCFCLQSPLLLLLSIFPSIREFPNELSVYIRWPKYPSFSFNISPFSEYSALIFLKIDWFELLAVQGRKYPLKPNYLISIMWLNLIDGKYLFKIIEQVYY